MAPLKLTDSQQKRISSQSLIALENSYALLCDQEVELESRVDTIRDLKSYILLEIEIKINGKK